MSLDDEPELDTPAVRERWRREALAHAALLRERRGEHRDVREPDGPAASNGRQ